MFPFKKYKLPNSQYLHTARWVVVANYFAVDKCCHSLLSLQTIFQLDVYILLLPRGLLAYSLLNSTILYFIPFCALSISHFLQLFTNLPRSIIFYNIQNYGLRKSTFYVILLSLVNRRFYKNFFSSLFVRKNI